MTESEDNLLFRSSTVQRISCSFIVFYHSFEPLGSLLVHHTPIQAVNPVISTPFGAIALHISDVQSLD